MQLSESNIPEAASIARAARIHRWGRGLIAVVMVAAAAMIPWLVFVSFEHSDEWRFVVLERAVRGGYFWEDIAGYLFQQTKYSGAASSFGEWFKNPFLFVVVMYLFAAGTLYALRKALTAVGAVTMSIARAQAAGKIHVIRTRIARSVLVRAFADNGVEAIASSPRADVWSCISSGAVLLALRVDAELPNVLMEASAGGKAAHLRRLHIDPHCSIVLEGAFLERYRVFAPRASFAVIPRIMSPNVLLQLSEIADAQYIEAIDSHLVARFPARALRTPEHVESAVAELAEAAVVLAERFADAERVSLATSHAVQVGVRRARSLRLGPLQIGGWWGLAALACILTIDLVQTLTTPGGIAQNTMDLHVMLVLWLLLARLAAPRMRRISGGVR